jgi:rhodanese-related sulfurtransferase
VVVAAGTNKYYYIAYNQMFNNLKMKKMKKMKIYLLVILLVPVFVITSCKKDDDDQPFNAQKALTDYLVDQQLDINKMLEGFVLGAPADGIMNAYHLIDIRSADDFAQGHIENSVNVAFADILTEAAKATKPIVIVCYTGQTATYAVSLLRLSGFADAKALKWGMSGWHSDFANHAKGWNGKTGDIADGHANWTNDPAPTNLTYDSPTFSSTSTDPQEILRARVAQIVADGFKTVTPDDVLANPGTFFINNYFSEAHYLGFGHINGAVRIFPMLVGGGDNEKVINNDASKKVVTYCYTGQTSAAITSYLRVIGYDAYSMVFGMNKLYHSSTTWSANQWGVTDVPKELPYVSN